MTHDPMQDANEAATDAPQLDETEALRAELEQLKAQSLIERADLENQRKRLAREIEQARKFANERLLGDLLPLFDAMEAGLANAAADDPLPVRPPVLCAGCPHRGSFYAVKRALGKAPAVLCGDIGRTSAWTSSGLSTPTAGVSSDVLVSGSSKRSWPAATNWRP